MFFAKLPNPFEIRSSRDGRFAARTRCNAPGIGGRNFPSIRKEFPGLKKDSYRAEGIYPTEVGMRKRASSETGVNIRLTDDTSYNREFCSELSVITAGVRHV